MPHAKAATGSFKIATGPSTEPVGLSDAKDHLRADGSSEDAHILTLLSAARRHVEQDTGLALITQTWDYALDRFPPGNARIEIPKAPLQTVGSITYHDEDLTTSTVFASAKYQVDTIPTPPVIGLKRTESWPSDTLRPSSGVVIRADFGFGANPADVPETLRQAILLLVSAMYEFREPEITGTIITKVGFSYDALVANHRLWSFQ